MAIGYQSPAERGDTAEPLSFLDLLAATALELAYSNDDTEKAREDGCVYGAEEGTHISVVPSHDEQGELICIGISIWHGTVQRRPFRAPNGSEMKLPVIGWKYFLSHGATGTELHSHPDFELAGEDGPMMDAICGSIAAAYLSAPSHEQALSLCGLLNRCTQIDANRVRARFALGLAGQQLKKELASDSGSQQESQENAENQ